MSVTPSPIGGFAAQFFDNNGVILSGGKIYTYAAGTTTPQATYTSASGVTPHANPIILDSAGRVPGGEIWLTDGLVYKFVIETATAILIGTYDNITGVNSNFINYTVQEEVIPATTGQTVFNLTTITYTPGTNSLTVYIDGVNQYVGDSYLETDSNTVTFTAGLHVGAQVKFTTAIQTTTGAVDASIVSFTGFKGQAGSVQDLAGNDGADWIGFEPAGTGAVAASAQEKLREVVSVKDFGAVGDGVTNDTAAFQDFSDYINSVGGGSYLIPPGEYLVGSQTFAGAFGLGYSYLGAPIITVENCTENVEIRGYGAKLKIVNGLKYGAFNPVTGAPFASTSPFFDPDYYATVGSLIRVEDNTGQVTVRGLELDGNLTNLVLGGPAGDQQIQLEAYGIICINNTAVHLEDIYTHHNGLDGVYATTPSTTGYAEQSYPVVLINVICDYNARQGLSYTGGKGLTAINCKFNNTGQGAFFAIPASGVDLEGEINGYAVNGMFLNCEFANNKTAGLNAAVNFADVSFYRCSFYGTTTSYALLIYNVGTRFFDCTIGGSSAIAGTASIEADRTYFRNCNFNSAAVWQSVSTTWPAEPLVATSLANPIFDACTFSTVGTTVPLNFSLPTTIYRDCTFNQSTFTGISYPKGTFQNSNSITAATGSIDVSGSTVDSPIRLLGAGTYIGLKTAADPLGGLTAYSSNNFVGLGFNTYLTPTTVGALPSASAVGAGSISFVTNANATTFGSIVAGGGVSNVPVYSDGANWRIG